MSNNWIDWNEGMGTHDGAAINDYNYWEGGGAEKGRLETLKDLCASDLAQFQEMLGIVKGEDGKDVKPDPGVAILFFITVMLPHMMDLHSAKVEEYADQMTELRHILEGITKLKDLMNQAKGSDDPSILANFKRLKDEIKSKIQNDSGWLKGLDEGTQKAFQDIDGLIDGKADNVLQDIWAEAEGTSIYNPFTPAATTSSWSQPNADTVQFDCSNEQEFEHWKETYFARTLSTLPDAYTFTNEPTFDPVTKKITVDLRGSSDLFKERFGLYKNNLTQGVIGSAYWYNSNYAPGGAMNPGVIHDHPDNTRLKTLLTAFDTLTTSSNNLSTDVQGDMKVETGTYDQFLTVYHDMAKEFISEIKKPIDKQE
jgi:hypothetical protein